MTDVKQKHWVKWWRRWYETPSHRTLSFDALHTGAFWAILAAESPEPGWLLGANGKPLSYEVLAREARVPGTPSKARLRVMSIFGELTSVGTGIIRDDGAFGFPNFDRWQESPGAPRTRRWRGANGEGTAPQDDPQQRHRDGARDANLASPRRHRDAACDGARDGPLSREKIRRSEDQKIRRSEAASDAAAGGLPLWATEDAGVPIVERLYVEVLEKAGWAPLRAGIAPLLRWVLMAIDPGSGAVWAPTEAQMREAFEEFATAKWVNPSNRNLRWLLKENGARIAGALNGEARDKPAPEPEPSEPRPPKLQEFL